jgi:threonine/homoserine/homoserine lactone efflux protein
MPTLETLMVFSAIAIAITLVPGPSMLYVASRSIVHGRTAGIWSALGLATGLLIHTASASLGLSAIFIYSPLAFFVIKYLGATYLIYLGVQMLLTKKPLSQTSTTSPPLSSLRIYGQGIITEILNPKTALFFLSLLPQFVDPLQGSSATQMMMLGCILAKHARNPTSLLVG